MDEAPHELRLVEVGHETCAAWLDEAREQQRRRRTLVRMTAALVGSLLLSFGLIEVVGFQWAMLVMLGANITFLGTTFRQERSNFHHLTLTSQRVSLGRTSTRGLATPLQPSVDAMKTLTPTNTKHLAFVDIAGMGHTDSSVWFVDDEGVRTEVRLDAFGRAEETIEPLWRAMRPSAAIEHGTRARRDLAQLRDPSGG